MVEIEVLNIFMNQFKTGNFNKSKGFVSNKNFNYLFNNFYSNTGKGYLFGEACKSPIQYLMNSYEEI